MTAVQFSIGALNDVADAASDRGRSPLKPVAEGLISPRSALFVATAAAVTGLGLSAISGVPTLLVVAAGAACGYAYDLRLSRTALAWLPLAMALPLVPVYAWVGATGTVPGGLLALVPIGMLAGAGLAVGNGLADLDADAESGAGSVAGRLGRWGAWRLHLLALVSAAALAVAVLPPAAPRASLVLLGLGALLLAAGASLLAGAGFPDRRQAARLGWGIEAIGVAVLGIGWAVALASGAAPRS